MLLEQPILRGKEKQRRKRKIKVKVWATYKKADFHTFKATKWEKKKGVRNVVLKAAGEQSVEAY